jgi:biopolymer transport protein ExbD
VKFERRAKQAVEVNLTPLIDVVFLLLIFFMVSTSFTKQSELTLALPTASGDSREIVPDLIELVVTKEGAYRVNGLPIMGTQVSALKDAIYRLSKGDTTLPMAIVADAQATHQSVVTAMDAAGQLGFSRLSIATLNPADESP